MSFFMVVTVWMLLLSASLSAGNKCKSELISSINVTTELQSDVLLPCIFEATLLGSNKSADIAAVWSQRDITVDNLVEIKLQGDEMFWSTRGRRIKAFPKLSESGNFSILLRNVQQSDLGLYRCELFEWPICSIAYQEVHLVHVEASPAWPITAGALGTGAVLLILLTTSCFYAKGDALDYSVYTSVSYTVLDDDCKDVQDNLICITTGNQEEETSSVL